MENAQTPEDLWNEVAAERSDSPVEKPSEPVAEEKVVEQPKAEEVKAEEPVAEEVKEEVAKPTAEEQLASALAEIEKLKTRQRNVEGHIGGLTSQQKQLSEMVAAGKSAAHAVKDAPTSDQIKEAAANPEQWEALKADFPEWSTATEKFIDFKLSSDSEKVSKLVNEAIASATTRITEEVEAKIVDKSLSAVFPGWKKQVASESFIKWRDAQPEEVRALAASDDVGDAAELLSLYRESQKANPVKQVQEARKQKLEQAVAAPRGSRSTPAKTWEDMTPEERWNSVNRERNRA